MIRLTPNGWIFLGLSVLLYFASLTSQSSLLLFPIGILLGCYLVNAWSSWNSVRCLQLSAARSTRLMEGENPRETWTAANHSKYRLGSGAGLARGRILFEIPPLRSGETAPIALQLRDLRRGVYRWDQIRLRSTFPFGLVEARRRLPLEGEWLVCPRLPQTAPPRANGGDLMLGGRLKNGAVARAGFDFVGVRPLEPSDSFRQVHWKASARGPDLMVKTFQQELSGRVAVLLDGFSSTAESFELALRLAGAMALAALEAGDQVEWIELQGDQSLFIPPFGDGSELWERLARAQRQPDPVTRSELERAVRQTPPRSFLHFVFAERNKALARYAAELKSRGRPVELHGPETFLAAPTARLGGGVSGKAAAQ